MSIKYLQDLKFCSCIFDIVLVSIGVGKNSKLSVSLTNFLHIERYGMILGVLSATLAPADLSRPRIL